MRRKIANRTAAETYRRQVSNARVYYAQQLRDARRIKQFDRDYGDVLGLSDLWWFAGSTLYFPIKGNDTDQKTKADFSREVRRIAVAVGEPPEISLSPREYKAEWNLPCGVRLHAYMNGATDCKTIEVEEMVKTLKPHPECLQALKVLEDL